MDLGGKIQRALRELLVLELELELELSQFDGHFFHGVERVSTCESGLQFIAI
ncbi:hypothetical protein C8R27_12742 [Nitrosomonas ureae]|nr:hypothetical protein C8R27_12742 [Nitrosomonas ureae]